MAMAKWSNTAFAETGMIELDDRFVDKKIKKDKKTVDHKVKKKLEARSRGGLTLTLTKRCRHHR